MNALPFHTQPDQSEPETAARPAKNPGRGRGTSVMALLGALVIILVLVAESLRGSVLLWDFEGGVVNAWGGRYNVYGRAPSWARTYLDPNIHRSASGHSLRVTAHREADGFCGVWLEFYEKPDGPPRILDASLYRYLSFWIKGEKGGEDVEIQLSDDAPERREELIPKRPLRAYLKQGVTTRWQEVLIPLSDFHGLNQRRVARLTLNFRNPTDCRFYLDDISLKRRKFARARPAKSAPAPVPAAAPASRAMWVWNTRNLLDRVGEVNSFLEFCSKTGISEVFLHLDMSHQASAAGPQFSLRNPDGYQAFLERAHGQGLTVEALAGTPEWAVRENHAQPLAVVDVVLAFNRSRPTSADFDGIHFDVEPSALLEFSDPKSRAQVLADFLEMTARAAERVKTEPGLRFGCDAPAWFYPASGSARRDLLVTFNGQEKTVGEHLTDLLDAVTIMDYRNQADGANGIIAGAVPALSYAASQGKKIRVGLETFAERGSTVYFACTLSPEEFYRRLAASPLRHQLFFEDFRLSTFSHEDHLHVGLVAPAERDGAARAGFERALVALAKQLLAPSDFDPDRVMAVLEEARVALQRNAEWKDFEIFELTDPQTRRAVPGFRAVHKPSLNATFHGLGREVFEEETRSAFEWLSPYPSFAGFAFHFYETYRNLLEPR